MFHCLEKGNGKDFRLDPRNLEICCLIARFKGL